MARSPTDILGGVQLGFRTVLVLSGGTRRADLERYAYRPTYVVNSIQDLLDDDVLAPLLKRPPKAGIPQVGRHATALIRARA